MWFHAHTCTHKSKSERSHQTHFVLICLICLQLSKDRMRWWWECSVHTNTKTHSWNYTQNQRMSNALWSGKWDGQAKIIWQLIYVRVCFRCFNVYLKIRPFCSLKKKNGLLIIHESISYSFLRCISDVWSHFVPNVSFWNWFITMANQYG